MLPSELVDYAKEFPIGFLVYGEGNTPIIEVVDFEIKKDYILIKGKGCKEGKACFVLANERYSENSKMAQISGRLTSGDEGCKLIPAKAYWTYPFSLSSYPKEIVKRWRRK